MAFPGVRFAVRLTPRGGLDRIEGVVDGELRARVAAPAVDGAANHAILRLIADELDVPRTAVRLAAGALQRIEGGALGRLLPVWRGPAQISPMAER